MSIQVNYISCHLPLTFDQAMKLLKVKDELFPRLVKYYHCIEGSIEINPFSGLSFKVEHYWEIEEIEYILEWEYGVR